MRSRTPVHSRSSRAPRPTKSTVSTSSITRTAGRPAAGFAPSLACRRTRPAPALPGSPGWLARQPLLGGAALACVELAGDLTVRLVNDNLSFMLDDSSAAEIA